MHDTALAIINQASNPMLLLDSDDRLLAWNPAWTHLLTVDATAHFRKGQVWIEACRAAGWQCAPTNNVSDSDEHYLLCKESLTDIKLTVKRTQVQSIFLLSVDGHDALISNPPLMGHPLSHVVENTNLPAYIRQKNRLVLANQRLAQMLEYGSVEELMKHNRLSDHFPVDIRDEVREYLENGAVVLDTCNQLVTRNNNLINFSILGDDFEVDGVTFHYAFTKNSTLTRKIERDLRLSEERFRDYAHCAADWFWETDADLRISHVSTDTGEHPAANTDTALDAGRQTRTAKAHLSNVDISHSGIRDLQLKRLPITDYEYSIIDNEGCTQYVQLNAIPVFNDHGRFTGYRGASRDISYQKNIEKSFINAKLRAEKQTEAKSEFLASVSHEIRTPLTNILGYIELLRRRATSLADPMSGDQQRAIDIIWKNGDQLRSLINNVIFIERAESGSDRVDAQSIDVVELMDEMQASFAVSVSVNGSELTVMCDPSVPDEFFTDSVKVRQILHNLVGNAVKFTEQGHISVQTRYADGKLLIEIEDDGPGIAPDHLERLNSLTTQSNVVHALESGSGLGLLLSHRYAEQLGGCLVFDRGSRSGTRILVSLPSLIRTPPSSKSSRSKLSSLVTNRQTHFMTQNLRVMIVDDNPAHRILLSRLLETSVNSIFEAPDGESAIEMYKQQQPDVIFLDLRMPKIDGRVVAARIRNIENRQAMITPGSGLATNFPRSRIVALTADGLTDPANLLATGMFDACITKPYDDAEIIAQLVRAIDDSPVDTTLQANLA